MPVICIDVVIKVGLIRDSVLEELGRAMWVAMVARLTFDSRLISVANQHVAEALTVFFLLEDLLGWPGDDSHG
jgi:hypothetical protein